MQRTGETARAPMLSIVNYLHVKAVGIGTLGRVDIILSDARIGQWTVHYASYEAIAASISRIVATIKQGLQKGGAMKDGSCPACAHILAAAGTLVPASRGFSLLLTHSVRKSLALQLKVFLNDFISACMMHFGKPAPTRQPCATCMSVYQHLKLLLDLPGCIHKEPSPCSSCKEVASQNCGVAVIPKAKDFRKAIDTASMSSMVAESRLLRKIFRQP